VYAKERNCVQETEIDNARESEKKKQRRRRESVRWESTTRKTNRENRDVRSPYTHTHTHTQTHI